MDNPRPTTPPPISAEPRKIPGGGRILGGYFPSSKMGRPIAWAGMLQRDFLTVVEEDPSITSIVEQPFELRLGSRGRDRWTPHFLLIRRFDTTLVSVRSTQKLSSPRATQRTYAEEVASALIGYGYRVETEISIRREPRFANARKLTLSCGHVCTQRTRHRVFVALSASSRPIAELLDPKNRSESWLEILSLCRAGTLAFDADQLLTEFSPVWLKDVR